MQTLLFKYECAHGDLENVRVLEYMFFDQMSLYNAVMLLILPFPDHQSYPLQVLEFLMGVTNRSQNSLWTSTYRGVGANNTYATFICRQFGVLRLRNQHILPD